MIDEIGDELSAVILGGGVGIGNAGIVGGIEGDGDGVTLLDSDNLSYLRLS